MSRKKRKTLHAVMHAEKKKGTFLGLHTAHGNWRGPKGPLNLLSLFSEADVGVPDLLVDVEVGVVAIEEVLMKTAASGEFGDNPRSFGQ